MAVRREWWPAAPPASGFHSSSVRTVGMPVDAALTASGQTRPLHRYRFRNDALDIIEQAQRQYAA
jgi:hypothetical protein